MTMKIDPAIKHMPLLQVQLFFWNDQKSQKPLGSYYKHWAISVHLGAGTPGITRILLYILYAKYI
jgi:hypothetical protein